MRIFRILVVDDKDVVRDRLQHELESKQMHVAEEEWRLEVKSVHVEVDQHKNKSEEFSISNSVVEKLSIACVDAFDLILVDYGYIAKEGYFLLRKYSSEGNKNLTRESLNKIILSPVDLAVLAKKYNSKKIKSNFLNHQGDVIVYTYTPPTLKSYYPRSEIRGNITESVFPAASNVNVINTSEEFYNDDEFMDKHDDYFYSYLVSRYLEQKITLCIYNKAIKIRQNLRVKRTSKFLAYIGGTGATVGLVSSYAGSLILGFGQSGNYTACVLLFFSIVVSFIIGGWYLIKYLEDQLNIIYHVDSSE